MTSANVPVNGLETSYSSSRSSGYDQQYDQIPFKMVDEHQSFHSRDAHSPSRPQNHPLYGCQSLRLGAHLEPMSLSFHGRWSEDQSQLHISMLEIMAIHFALIKSLKYIHNSRVMMRWSGGAKVLCILHHRGVQLILAYSWARPAILVVGKGRGGMFLFLLFLHFHSCSSFLPVPLFHLLYSLFCLFSPFLWETTQNDPQGLTCR